MLLVQLLSKVCQYSCRQICHLFRIIFIHWENAKEWNYSPIFLENFETLPLCYSQKQNIPFHKYKIKELLNKYKYLSMIAFCESVYKSKHIENNLHLCLQNTRNLSLDISFIYYMMCVSLTQNRMVRKKKKG